MNANSDIDAAEMPKIALVKAATRLCVDLTWKKGRRAGRTETVDLAPLINSLKFYRPLRKNRGLFESIHLVDGGKAFAWGNDGALDMAATSVERLAEERAMRPPPMDDNWSPTLPFEDRAAYAAAWQAHRCCRDCRNWCVIKIMDELA